MNNKNIDVIISVLSILLWFAPFNSFVSRMPSLFQNGRVINGFQSGQHLGGFAVLLLIFPIGYAIASWNGNKDLQKIAAATHLLISIIFFIPRLLAGNIKFGLIIITGLAIFMVYRSFSNKPNIKSNFEI